MEIAVADEQHQSLLRSWSHKEEDVVPLLPFYEPDGSKYNLTSPNKRLVSLDVFRSLTVALMILVDDAGGAFPTINHSPWFGVTLADFVMPFFLFIRNSDKPAATKKVIVRSIKLFVPGLLLQGGYFHGRNNLTYGVDIEKMRWLGVLQRISIGYFLVSLLEIWLVKSVIVDSLSISFCKEMLLSMVKCGVRGSLEPSCNAVGLIDRPILGEHHLYQECSVNSPDYGLPPPDSPGWCLAPFDPKGFISSLMAAVSCFLGLHFGHVIVHFEGSMQRIVFWSMSSFSLLISGYTMKILGMPLCKPLYTLSYTCITAGASGLLLTIIYYMVDVKHIRMPTILLQWMGMNALIVYALAACDVFPAAVQGFFWHSPEFFWLMARNDYCKLW